MHEGRKLEMFIGWGTVCFPGIGQEDHFTGSMKRMWFSEWQITRFIECVLNEQSAQRLLTGQGAENK